MTGFTGGMQLTIRMIQDSVEPQTRRREMSRVLFVDVVRARIWYVLTAAQATALLEQYVY